MPTYVGMTSDSNHRPTNNAVRRCKPRALHVSQLIGQLVLLQIIRPYLKVYAPDNDLTGISGRPVTQLDGVWRSISTNDGLSQINFQHQSFRNPPKRRRSGASYLRLNSLSVRLRPDSAMPPNMPFSTRRSSTRSTPLGLIRQ